MSAATRGMVPRRGTSAEVGRHIRPLARDNVGQAAQQLPWYSAGFVLLQA